MEWIVGGIVTLVFALYLWSLLTTRREVSKRIQPVVDSVFWPEESSAKRDVSETGSAGEKLR